MGIKGRKRRLRNFKERARAFTADVVKRTGRGYKRLEFDGKELLVGAGKNRRLIGKGSNIYEHLLEGQRRQEMLQQYLRIRQIVPKNYGLVRPASALIDPNIKNRLQFTYGVQEFFHRPNLLALEDFLRLKQTGFRNKGEYLQHWMRSKEEYFLCKRLMNQHKVITKQKVEDAAQEIGSHLWGAGIDIALQNLVVVGVTRQGRLRLAIVDA